MTKRTQIEQEIENELLYLENQPHEIARVLSINRINKLKKRLKSWKQDPISEKPYSPHDA